MTRKIIHHTANSVMLFTSFSTLFCCALPALFVALGAGAALAGIVTNVPQLIWLSYHKIGLFIFSGLMLAVSGTLRYTSRNAPCPIDPVQAESCKNLRRNGGIVYVVSLLIYATGFFFAFIAPHLFG
jgi:hypothetical protein